MVAAGPLSQPMGSCPPSHSNQSMSSWAEVEVESPFVLPRMKSKQMLPGMDLLVLLPGNDQGALHGAYL